MKLSPSLSSSILNYFFGNTNDIIEILKADMDTKAGLGDVKTRERKRKAGNLIKRIEKFNNLKKQP